MTQAPQATPHQAPELLYVVVFGYPPDKYSVTVEYFKQLGETTDPDPNTEVSNCFKIGFKNPVEAMWAVRKNGDIVGGSWMVGVKWAVRHRSISLLMQMEPTFFFFPGSQPSRSCTRPSSGTHCVPRCQLATRRHADRLYEALPLVSPAPHTRSFTT